MTTWFINNEFEAKKWLTSRILPFFCVVFVVFNQCFLSQSYSIEISLDWTSYVSLVVYMCCWSCLHNWYGTLNYLCRSLSSMSLLFVIEMKSTLAGGAKYHTDENKIKMHWIRVNFALFVLAINTMSCLLFYAITTTTITSYNLFYSIPIQSQYWFKVSEGREKKNNPKNRSTQNIIHVKEHLRKMFT